MTQDYEAVFHWTGDAALWEQFISLKGGAARAKVVLAALEPDESGEVGGPHRCDLTLCVRSAVEGRSASNVETEEALRKRLELWAEWEQRRVVKVRRKATRRDDGLPPEAA